MEIGTIETLPDPEEKQARISKATGTSSASSGNGGGGGSGGDGPDGGDRHDVGPDEQVQAVPDKSKYIAWFLLMAVGMTFAGLLGAYLMIATNRAAEWKPFDLPVQIWISTAVIILSSVAYAIAERGIARSEFLTGRKWLLITTVLGAVFIASQLIVWIGLVNRGYYLSGNPYAGFFYILTAAHLVHVAGGMAALSSVLLKCWYPAVSETEAQRRRDLSRSVGWYWHFMGFLWVLLFLMLGFWK